MEGSELEEKKPQDEQPSLVDSETVKPMEVTPQATFSGLVITSYRVP